jgi:threonine-phosphate decarboxylase
MKKDINTEPEKLIHGGDIYSAREQLSKLEKPPAILDFSANINPFGLPEGVKQAIRDAAESFDIYPDPLCRELVSGLSVHEGIPREWILCGNGAADVIYRTVYAVRPKKAMVLAPTFAEYEEALTAAGCRTVPYELRESDGFQAGNGLLEALDEGIDMLFLCNPNNPTGQLLEKDFLRRILQRCKELGILLFMDECFNEFLEDPQNYTTKEYLEAFDNLIILKAFTKIYAMAGLRLGYCISANTGLLKKVREAGQPWSVSAPAQIAGIRAMEEKAYLAKTKKLIREEREYLVQKLTELRIRVIASNANYIFVKDDGNRSGPLHEMLFEKGIMIRNCDNYRGLCPGYYRICIRKHEENIVLVGALKMIKEG